jgi:8-oxo-dGTP diphosphatase
MNYPRPVVTCDMALFSKKDGHVSLLLVKRGAEPHKGMWALPGGHLEEDEELSACALRELSEETNIPSSAIFFLDQVEAVGTLGRDPRDRYITVLYGGVVGEEDTRFTEAGDDATECKWVPLHAIEYMDLAFDHQELCRKAINWFARMEL